MERRTWAVAEVLGFLVLVAAYSGQADSLVLRTGEEAGTFEGYANQRIMFRTTGGKTLEEPSSNVQSLTLDKPAKVSILMNGKKEPEDGLLKGYKGSKFLLDAGGKEKGVIGAMVKEITVAAAPAMGVGGAAGWGAPVPIPAMDLSGVDANPNLTDVQKAALEGYKNARAAYDTFLARNNELRAQMDAAKGPAREKLLDELRVRKVDEQGVRQTLLTAQAALQAALP